MRASSSFDQALFGVGQNGLHLLARDAWEPVQEFADGGSAFEVLKERLNGHAASLEEPRSAHLVRPSFDRRALAPIKHDKIVRIPRLHVQDRARYLSADSFAGYADFLVRHDGPCKLGALHYEVWDTKLARSTPKC